ncbi:cupin domain-containing protein [Haloterrigena sp. SYSU A558-1]|uniref:Cupin domain-containing protein n=1 Tax=Haloterrigena gelatinilytica TaxID=2741724 RepID=A0ABX2LG22_9EURY|nr:cupin domain-containing protein [Haloterrigena gelatinilytica]NUC73515.1 cupin domain-containing protein [Haloterrigena gelatinilytica]
MERVSIDDCEPSEAADGVHLALLAGTDSMNVQHFEIEPGATVDEHSHPHDQTGYIAQGELTFLVEGEETVCGPGDSYAIPGDQPHAAENRGDETVRGVDIFSPPRENPSWQED